MVEVAATPVRVVEALEQGGFGMVVVVAVSDGLEMCAWVSMMVLLACDPTQSKMVSFPAFFMYISSSQK